MPDTTEVTQRSEFSCCYIVHNFDETYSLNCHNYKFEATVSGHITASNRIISFEDFKALIDSVIPNSCFLYNVEDQSQKLISQTFSLCGISTLGFGEEISAEIILNQISLMLVQVLKEFSSDLFLKETKLRETSNSYVTWKQEVI